jgi:hypothetical protein
MADGRRARLEGEVSCAAFACKRGYITPSVFPALETSAQETSIFAAFPRRSPTPNSFLMASINLDDAQFWDPLSNSFLPRQYTSLNNMSKSTYPTSSRNQPILLHNKPAGMFKHNCQSTSEIAPAQYQRDDSATRAQGKIGENARNEPV